MHLHNLFISYNLQELVLKGVRVQVSPMNRLTLLSELNESKQRGKAKNEERVVMEVRNQQMRLKLIESTSSHTTGHW